VQPVDLEPHKEYFKKLINLYHDYLDLPIILRFADGDTIYSEDCPYFCKMIQKRYPSVCTEAISKEDLLSRCKMGVPCYSFYTKYTINLGAVHIGQKLIKGEESVSRDIFVNTMLDLEANDLEFRHLLDNFDKLDIIELNSESEIHLNKALNFIKRHFDLECARIYHSERRVQELKMMAENLAHQLLTPIQGVLGNAENLIQELNDLPQSCQNVELHSIANDNFTEIQKLALCADNLRNWIMSERKYTYRYDFHIASIVPILMRAIKMFRSEAKYRGIMLENPELVGSAPPILRLSEEHMTRVFYNLINNAVKYSYDGTPKNQRYVEVKCKYIENYYCIDITNYGVGILPEELDGIIYEAGYRGKLAKDRNRTGCGLGMGIAKKIIEDHGGHIEIFSESQGKSSWDAKNPFKTTVRVCLPLL